MPLEDYHRKRDFGRTPEPAGTSSSGPTPAGAGRFVVQRHRASRLHHDFRLEIGGVLASWAIPRGPTLDPAERRMAVHVEDHPIEYIDFEGVIPARQYGAGDVIVWDWGTYEPEAETPEPAAAVANGEIKFRLHGEKLRGRFTLVRTDVRRRGGRVVATDTDEDGKEQWLLIKKRDEAAVEGWNPDDHPRSVKTGRTNDEVKAERSALWIGAAPAATAEIDLSAAVEGSMPKFIEPMSATLATAAFSSDDWLFEVKWDGYRVEAVISGDRVRLFTRKGNDAATYFPGLLSPPTWIDADRAIVDGEVVALQPDGSPSFELLQQRIGGAADPVQAPLVYQAFDLLYLDGRSLLRVPLEQRKALLRSVIRPDSRAKYAGHVVGDGEAFFKAAAEHALEGIVAKRRASLYQPGRRAETWLKLKARGEQELVIGGWLPGAANAKDLGAIIVGYHDDGHLRYAGRVGSGLDGRTRADLLARLTKLTRSTPAFEPAPPRTGDLRAARWSEPILVARVEFSNWTREGIVRQPVFKGLDPEADPAAVTRDRPISPEAANEAANRPTPQSTRARPQPDEAAVRTPRRTLAVPRAAKPDGAAEPGSATTAARVAGAVPGGAVDTSAPSRPSRRSPATGASGDSRLPQEIAEHELTALARLDREGTWEAGGESLKLTNLDKILFPPAAGQSPNAPITKRELIAYFARVAPVMLPHLTGRPLNLHRYPNGTFGPGFWQKDIPPTAPSWLRIWHEVGTSHGREANDHLVADRAAALCWLGNQAAFEIHGWPMLLEDVEHPTFALIDIDPGEKTTWDETLVLARLFRTALDHLHVSGYPKVTGQRGIQIWIPIEPRYTFRETSSWVEGISRAVASTVPDLVSWEWSKAERRGRARLDYTQNGPTKTLVAPYAVRPASGAPVSAPIDWAELDDPELRPARWTIRTILDRVADRGDLFAGALGPGQVLPSLGT